MKVSTDENKIEEILTRGVENVFPNADFLKERLKKGEKLTIYMGIDPTGPTLHMGYAVVLRKLRQFQDIGHKIILLIGDFTALIGDPTDKSTARVIQTKEQVLQNAMVYKEQASHFLDFKGENPVEIKHNSEWLGKMNFAEVLELASNMTYAQTIKRSMFQERIAANKDLFVHEFLYPLMQGYDSVAMGVDGEIGGNDQTFNMLVGRDLMKKIKHKEKFVVAMKLLVDQTGKKMGKTEGNMVAFTDSANDAFGMVMSWPDTLMPLAYELCTDEDYCEGDPMENKLKLAELIVAGYWGKKEAEKARISFASTFSKGEVPDDIREVQIEKGREIREVLTQEGIVQSRSDFQRLVKEGAVEFDGEKVLDLKAKIEKSGVIKVGKHRFLKVSI